jgi:type IV pilus assembly protein PilA
VRPPEAGFTMLEMMVVLGIVAILMLLAVPTYQDKFIRDQIVESLPLADIAKKPVAAAWAALQAFPDDNAAAGLPSADRIVNNYVSSVAIENGAVQITFGNRANGNLKGKILTLRPAIVEDAPVVPVAWVCGQASVPGKMTAKGQNRTNIRPITFRFSADERPSIGDAPSSNRFLAEGLAVYLHHKLAGNGAFPNFGRPLDQTPAIGADRCARAPRSRAHARAFG